MAATPASPDAGAAATAASPPSMTETKAARAPQTNTWLPGERTAFSAAVERSLSEARKFAWLSGRDAAVAAGEIMAALGDAIASIPNPDRRRQDKLDEVRFQAKRLQRSDRMAFGVAKWIKSGLAAAVDGLEPLVPANETTRFWIALARESQRAVDPGSAMTFQRAALQDAVRTTISAFVVAGQGLEACR